MSETAAVDHRSSAKLGALALGTLGIVYGDIGTSPLYAFRESFEGAGHELVVSEQNVLGVLSLVFWSLIIVISIKYLAFVMRADNDGEGGILALTALVRPKSDTMRRSRWALILVGLFGTALLYGDGMITPAISVLSAVEGTEVATDAFTPWVIPVAVVILIGLFAVQRWGTGSVGKVFGPVMVVWFSVLGLLGLLAIADEPAVVRAVSPTYFIQFFAENGVTGFLALGSVFLVVTGGEALYADMGHFGRLPIAVSWYGLVLPALLLNYFGQGALLIEDPGAIDNPFYRLAPSWGLLPLVVLATGATVIASQALISGAFSLTRQASQLGYAPRLKIEHTSYTEMGQIYVPAVNWALMICCVGLVIAFRSSTHLAAAYGVAVTMTMAITTLLFYVVARERFRWGLPHALLLCGLFLVVDLAFFGANIPKIPHGGWFPLVAGAFIFTLLTTWNTGRRIVGDRLRKADVPLSEFVDLVEESEPTRLPGAAAYLFSLPDRTPPALRTNYRLQGALHEDVLIVSVLTENTPTVSADERLVRTDCGCGIQQVELHFGFKESPDVPRALGMIMNVDHITYFLGAEAIFVTHRPGMALWREHLYAFMHRNATAASNYFHLPNDRTVGISNQVEL